MGCDWFDTPQRPGVLAGSVTIQIVAPAIQFIAVLLLFVLLIRRRGRPDALALIVAGAAGVGSTLLLFASLEQFWYLSAPGIAILGIGWLGAARLMPSRPLAVVTAMLGVAALLEAVDSGIVLLPLFPVGPVWARVVLEAVWIVWAAGALIKSARHDRAAPGRGKPVVT
jgi:hypothetical protein